MNKIIHNRPCFGINEINEVRKVIDRHWLIEGKEVERFQNSMRALVKTKYAVAVNSGLSALHLSLVALGVQKSDEVIIPSYTCVALLHAINYVGATPVVVDIEDRGFNMDPSLVKKKLSKKTKAIIVPHMLGFPARIEEIKKFNVPVIEDCALALGSYYKGRVVGCFGNISIFSFYASKMIATGQGGMVIVNNKDFFELVYDLIHSNRRDDYRVRYNYQLTDLAAGIGNVQLKKLRSFIARRKKIARVYQEVLDKTTSVRYFPKKDDTDSNYYRFIIEFDDQKTRDTARNKLDKEGISSIPPVETFELLHNLLKLNKRDFLNSEKRSKTTLSIPIYPCLEDEEVARVSEAIRRFF